MAHSMLCTYFFHFLSDLSLHNAYVRVTRTVHDHSSDLTADEILRHINNPGPAVSNLLNPQ